MSQFLCSSPDRWLLPGEWAGISSPPPFFFRNASRRASDVPRDSACGALKLRINAADVTMNGASISSHRVIDTLSKEVQRTSDNENGLVSKPRPVVAPFILALS